MKKKIQLLTREDFEKAAYKMMVSDAEKEVFELYIRGFTVEETAEKVKYTTRQVERMRKKIRDKLLKI